MKNLLDNFFEFVAILKIIASPVLIGVFLGVICFVEFPNIYGLVTSVFIVIIGFILGVLFVKRIKKKTSAEEFNAIIYASPDIKEISEKENN